jgi:REJ domain/PLAT/LH2 domain
VEIETNSFEIGDNVKFYLTVQSKKTRLSDFAIQEIQFVDSKPLFVWTKCIKNCDRNVLLHETYHAQAVCEDCNSNSEKKFKWTLNSNIISNSSRAVVLPFKLKNERNVLNVKVYEGERIGEAFLVIKPLKQPTVDCKITPSNGVEFITNFTIDCTSTATHFEVFQDNALIGKFYSKQIIAKLKASNGIQIKVIDDRGAFTEINVPISVEELTIESVNEFIMGLTTYSSLHQLIASNDFKSSAAMIYVAIKNLNEENAELMTKIIEEIYKIPLADAETILIVTDVLRKIAEKTKTEHFQRPKVGLILKEVALKLKIFHEIRSDEARNITKNVLAVVENLSFPLEIMENQNNELIPADQRLDDYLEYGDFDNEIIEKMNNLLSTGNNIEKVVKSLLQLLAKFVEPEEPAIEMTSENHKFIVFGKDFSESLTGQNISLYSSKVVIESYNMILHEIIKVSLISFKNLNPFWFVEERNLKRSSFITFEIFHVNNQKIKKFSNPIKILNFIEPMEVSQHSVCVESSNDMPTYRMKVSANSHLVVEYNVSHGQDLKYILQFNKKPQFKDFTLYKSETKTINGSALIQVPAKQNQGDFFISFLPGKTNRESCTNLSLQFYVVSCEVWNGNDGSWNKKVCNVGSVLNRTIFDCFCHQPGSFTASVEAKSAWLDPSREIKNSLDQNFIVLGFVIAVFMTTIVIFIFMSCKNELKPDIIYLKSNHPDATHLYIITVVTGALKNSGTTSQVCIEIIGTESSIGVLWLNDNGVNFSRKSELKFMLLTSSSLGNVEKLAVWIKPFGYEVSWRCDKILMFKPSTSDSWTFLVQSWFTLKNDEAEISREFFPSKDDDFKKKRSLFLQNLHREYVSSFLSSRYGDFKNHLVIATLPVFSMFINSFLFGTTTTMNIEDEIIEYQHFELFRVLKMSVASFLILVFLKILINVLIKIYYFLKRLS